MERKLRNRVNKNDAQLLLIKMLPWLFLILLYILGSSIGVLATGPFGPNQPGLD